MKLWMLFFAVTFIYVGYKADPFKSKAYFRSPSSVEITKKVIKIENYIRVGNIEGAQQLLGVIKKHEPTAEVIPLIEKQLTAAAPHLSHPQVVQRLPAALRDLYFDSYLLSIDGNCTAATKKLEPIYRYLNQAEAEQINLIKCSSAEVKK